jgi:hypothetical protein
MLNLKLELFNYKKTLDYDTQAEVSQIVENAFNQCEQLSEKRVIRYLNEKLNIYKYDKSVTAFLENLSSDMNSNALMYNLKDLYKIVELKNQGGMMYRPALVVLLEIINTDEDSDKMNKILNELSIHDWIPEVKHFVYSLTNSPKKKTNFLNSGEEADVYTIVESVEGGHIALVDDSWFLLKEDVIEKTLLESHVKDEKLKTLRNLQTAMKYAIITEKVITFRISESISLGMSTKNNNLYINNEEVNKETTLESVFNSPIIPIINRNFYPLIKETFNNMKKFVILDVVKLVENRYNPHLKMYTFNYKNNNYVYSIDKRFGSNLYKYESVNELINDVKNECKYDITEFYKNKLNNEQKVMRQIEDQERQIKIDISDLDKNIDKVEANIKMVGESLELNEALELLNTEKSNLNTLLITLKEVKHKEMEKYKIN